MSATLLVHEAHAAETPLLIIERFLRDREGVWQQISQEYRLNGLIRQMLLSSTGALAGYGAVIGFSHSWLQALSSAIKLPIVFLLTLAICLPTLYLFNLLFGGRLSARQVLALMLSAITVTAIFTLAFAPISFFFLVTAQSYAFFLLLNVAILALTSMLGLQFLVSGVQRINVLALQYEAPTGEQDEQWTPAARRPRFASMGLLHLWLILYAFVGTQLGWTLRPFFGYQALPFQLFRSIEGNFYTGVVETFLHWLP